MYCINCGAQFADRAKFCPACGTSTEGVVISGPTQQAVYNSTSAGAPAPQDPRFAAAPTQMPYYQPATQSVPGSTAMVSDEFDGPIIMVAGALFGVGVLLELLMVLLNRSPVFLLHALPLVASTAICFVKPTWASRGIVGALLAECAITAIMSLYSFVSALRYVYSPVRYLFSLIPTPLILLLLLALLVAGVFDLLPNRNIAPIGMAALTALNFIRVIISFWQYFMYDMLTYAVCSVLTSLVTFAAYTLVCYAIQRNRDAAGQPITKRI